MGKTGLMAVLVYLATGVADAHAIGFMQYEHNASATGMADCRTAVADDVSAVFYNPAALTELDGLQLQLGTTGILPFVSYQPADEPRDRSYLSHDNREVMVNDGENDAETKVRGYTPVHLFASWAIPDTGVTVAYGLFSPFGLGIFWPGDWDGRFITTETDLATFFNQANVAVDVARLLGFKKHFKLSVAAGYDFVYATALLARRIDLRATEVFYPDIDDPWGEMKMEGNATGHGWNLALYAEIPKLLAFGASLRSGVRLDFSGTARFWFNPAGQVVRDNLLDFPEGDKTNGKVTIDLPWNMNFGLAFLGVEDLIIALDLWIAFFESYDELDLRFSCLDDEDPCSDLAADPMKTNWGTGWQLSLGVEYRLTEAWAVRAGYGTVFSPVPDETYDPSLPDGRRDMYCLGGGWRGDWLKVDLGYMLVLWDDDKDNDVGGYDNPEGDTLFDKGNPNGKANGRYSTLVHLLALTLSARF